MLCLRLYNQPLTTLPVVRCRLPFAAMEKFEQLKARVNSELKVQKQWEECAWTTARNAGVGALVGVFAAMILVPRTFGVVLCCPPTRTVPTPVAHYATLAVPVVAADTAWGCWGVGGGLCCLVLRRLTLCGGVPLCVRSCDRDPTRFSVTSFCNRWYGHRHWCRAWRHAVFVSVPRLEDCQQEVVGSFCVRPFVSARECTCTKPEDSSAFITRLVHTLAASTATAACSAVFARTNARMHDFVSHRAFSWVEPAINHMCVGVQALHTTLSVCCVGVTARTALASNH